MTRIAIYGAGAIGGYLGAKLAQAGSVVSLVARGPHLAAIRAKGLILIEGEKTSNHSVLASDDPADLGPQDYVVVTLKAHSIPAAVPAMKHLLGDETAVVFAVNGVPWWYFYDHGGPHDGYQLKNVDPDHVIWNGIGPERAIGCVVYAAAEVTEPGIVTHASGHRFSLGEPSGQRTERVEALSKSLIDAGLRAPIRPAIREEIWVKLWGNASFNPVSALTGATLAGIVQDPGTRQVVHDIMREVAAIAEALGVRMPISIDKRIAGAEAVGEHKTSMLQDLEKGRPMEIDALVGAVQELGQVAGVKTPCLNAILALVKQRAQLSDCYTMPTSQT